MITPAAKAAFVTLCTVAATSACGDDREAVVEQPRPLPLRPLVYTEEPGFDPAEAARREEQMLAEFTTSGRIPPPSVTAAAEPTPEADISDNILEADVEEVVEVEPQPVAFEEMPTFDLSSPEGLAQAVFDNIRRQNESGYQALLIDADGLIALSGLRSDTARERAGKLVEAAMKPYETFSSKNASEEPRGGVGSTLRLSGVEIGKPGTLWGKTPRRGEDTVQYWGTTVVFALTSREEPEPSAGADEDDKPVEFRMTLPRMLKTPAGEWRLAAAPQLSSNFVTYLSAGIHLKPELLQPEHYDVPLSVGNFWRYRIRDDDSAPEPRKSRLLTRVVEEIRVEVSEIERYAGYRLVTLSRQHKGEETKTSQRHYLVTPRRVYTCDKYCASRAGDLGWVLDHIRGNTPMLVLPLTPGLAWTAGGTVVREGDGRVQTEPELATVSVPAGKFAETFAVKRRHRHRTTTHYFKPGIGFVKREYRSDGKTRVEELVDMRLLGVE